MYKSKISYIIIIIFFACFVFNATSQQIKNTDTLKQTNLTTDTISIPIARKSSKTIDAAIDYQADDSIRFDIKTSKIFLYKNAIIKYKDIELKADYVEINLDSNLLFASGFPDSLGIMRGEPHFIDGSDEFNARAIKYNFTTERGIIYGVFTEQGGGYLHSEKTKRQPNEEVHIQHGKYTTCDAKHPHFYVALSKAKVIPNDKVISGPACFVLEDITLPIGIPFGFFPIKKQQTSGVLIPQYGEEINRGMFLSDGGYYFAINDYADLSIRGDIYSKGSWATKFSSNYKKRYKFNGNFNFEYSKIISGEKGLPDYLSVKSMWIRWTHTQDPKAHPSRTFSANVNMGSAQHQRFNSYNINNIMANTWQSSISYNKRWLNSPFVFSANFKHSQNRTDSTVSFNMPILNFAMARIKPFEQKIKKGKNQWFENIGLSYSGIMDNNLTTKENMLFNKHSLNKVRNGIKHTIPISTSMKIAKYFSLSPSITFTDRMYFNKLNYYWDSTTHTVIFDTIKQANAFVWDYFLSASLTTKLYGFFMFKKLPVKAIRHVLTPSVSFSYRPDFSKTHWKYYNTYVYDTLGNTRIYSYYQNGIYGTPLSGKYGVFTFSISNNLEMKVRNRKDSVTQTKKIALIDYFTISSSYNLAKDSLRWSAINFNGRTNLFKRIDVFYSANLDPYIMVKDTLTGRQYNINEYEWKYNRRIARWNNASWNFSLNYRLGPELYEKKNNDTKKNTIPNIDDYVDFNIPWSMNVTYNMIYNHTYYYKVKMEQLYPYTYLGVRDTTSHDLLQTIAISGDINITNKWKIGYRADYDFKNKKFGYASVDIYRDLHCWEMRFSWIPFGFYKSYNFQINAKSSILQDLKLNKRRSWYDNF